MEEFQIVSGWLIRYRGTAADITVPEGIRKICTDAFVDCPDLRIVRIDGALPQFSEDLLSHMGRALLLAPALPHEFITKKANRLRALQGFLRAEEEGLAYENEASWRAYALQEMEWLCRKAAEDPGLLGPLLREKLLTREGAQSLLREADIETRLRLLNYLQETFPAGEEDE